MDQNSDIDAWRRVHNQLTMAIVKSRDNISAELTKRRYLLEEMNRCKIQSTLKSPAKKMAVLKKLSPAAAVGVAKAKKMPPSTIIATDAIIDVSPTMVIKTTGVVSEPKKAPPATGMGGDTSPFSQIDNDDGDQALHPSPHVAEITNLQMSYDYDAYGNLGMGMATAQQMDLAFQMMQQINQNASAEDDGVGEKLG